MPYGNQNQLDSAVFARVSNEAVNGQQGLSVREYAAIHLGIPDSQIPDLDAMIAKAWERDRLRVEKLAAKLQQLIERMTAPQDLDTVPGADLEEIETLPFPKVNSADWMEWQKPGRIIDERRILASTMDPDMAVLIAQGGLTKALRDLGWDGQADAAEWLRSLAAPQAIISGPDSCTESDSRPKAWQAVADRLPPVWLPVLILTKAGWLAMGELTASAGWVTSSHCGTPPDWWLEIPTIPETTVPVPNHQRRTRARLIPYSCPSCGGDLLENDHGARWCSRPGCIYRLRQNARTGDTLGDTGQRDLAGAAGCEQETPKKQAKKEGGQGDLNPRPPEPQPE